MAQTAVVETSRWQEWERRIVGGRFTLLECLESSEQCAFYLTEVNGQTALLKLLRADSPGADAQVAGWELAGNLSHPNLVRIFEVGRWHADEELDMHFAVMEYCEESLAEVLRVRTLTPDEGRAMLTPLLDALQYLHQHGVVHGHLNPANIRAHGDRLKLTSDELRRSGEAGLFSTSGAYHAPDNVAGRGAFSADIWSLGMTLCQALTKRLPPPGKDARPQIPAEIPAPFDAIVQQCFAMEPGRRVSLNSIRALLDRPVDDLKLRREPVAQGNLAFVDLHPVRPAASKAKVDTRATEEPPQTWTSRRSTLIAGAAFFLLMAILIGLRVKQKTADTPGSAVTVSQSGITASSPAPGTAHHALSPARESGSVLHQVLPEVTGQARGTIHGTVKIKVRVAVDAHGRVVNASVAAKSPSAYFGRQALQAARQWTFSAPVRDGRPQPAEWIIRFEFRRSGTRVAAQPYSAST